MYPFSDDLLFFDDLAPERQRALRDALSADPALAETLARWHAIRAGVRRSLDADVPEGRVLVLYALDASGRSDLLTPEEQGALAEARPALDRALALHPALRDVTADVAEACEDFEAAWAEHLPATPARRPAPDRAARRPQLRRREALRWGWRTLAGSAVVAFVAVLMLVLTRDQGMQTLTTAPEEVRQVTLADGSAVRLLGGSALTYAPEAGAFNRRVRLDGQAFFDVQPGREGFVVETPTATATVLGTSFGIRADAATMEVVLASGRLAVASRAAESRVVVLEPGQMSRVARNALPTTPAEVDVAGALAWTGLLVFRAAPVPDVAARLAARYEILVDVPEALAGERFTGTFAPEQPAEEVLRALALTLDATLEGDAESGFRIVP